MGRAALLTRERRLPDLQICCREGVVGDVHQAGLLSTITTITTDILPSRSGPPDWKTTTGSPTPPEWSKNVTWARGNILSPSTYRQYLVGATAIVHSMGILLEADYKSVLTGKESPIAGLKKAFDSARATSHNPLREEGENAQLTYETMNRDSGNYDSPKLRIYLYIWACSRIAFTSQR